MDYETESPDEVENESSEGSEHESAEWLDRARDAYTTSTQWFDSSVRTQINKSYRQFQGLHQEDSKYDKDTWKLRNKTFIPKTRSAIERGVAMAANAFFSNQDAVAVDPVDDNNPAHHAAADLFKYILQHRLTKTIPWFQTLCGAFQECQSVGVVASKQTWEFDATKGVDRPRIDLIPLENLRFDPAADWFDPIGTSPYVIHMMPMYAKDVLAQMNKGVWKKYSLGQICSSTKQSNDSTRSARESQRQDSKDVKSAVSEFSVVWVHECIMDIGEGDVVFYTLGTELLLSDPLPLREVYPIGQRPIKMGVYAIEPHRNYPSSLCDLTRDIQVELNETVNLRRDNIRQVLMPQSTVVRNKNVDVRSITRHVPGSVVLVQEHTDVSFRVTPDVTGSAFQEQDRLQLDFDEVAGAMSNASVMSNNTLGETVGGLSLVSDSASIVSEYRLRTFVETWVEPVLRQIVLLEKIYENDALVLQLAGKSIGLADIPEELLQMDVLVTVNVGIGATNPQAQLDKFVRGMQALSNLGLPMIQKLKEEEVIKELFGKLGYRDGMRFFDLNPEADPVAQEMQQLEIGKLKAEIEKLRSETMTKNVEGLFSATQTAQMVATIPAVVPIADGIALSAGFKDQNEAPLIPQASGPIPEAMQQVETSPGVADNTHPNFPANPATGMMDGIETMKNEGLAEMPGIAG